MDISGIDLNDPRIISGLIGAFIASIVGMATLLISNHLQNKRQSRQHEHEYKLEHSKLLKEKAERLYNIFIRWQNDIEYLFAGSAPYLQGHMKKSEALDQYNLRKEEISNELADEIHTLVVLYFPQLQGDFNDLINRDVRNMFYYFPHNIENQGDLPPEYEDRMFYKHGSPEYVVFESNCNDFIKSLLGAMKEIPIP